MKIAIVTCSPQNDYPRARTLRTAFASVAGVDMLVVRNRHRGILRYPETVIRLTKTRLLDRPDAYVVTFRGYETLLMMASGFVRKPIIFDELINFTEWMEEQGRLRHGSLPYRIFRRWYAWLAGHSRIVLADTDAHAEYSAILNMLSIKRYRTIPVNADETVFNALPVRAKKRQTFTVLYYGHMVALHGLQHVLDAAVLLKGRDDITFRLIGGKQQGQVARACAAAAARGAQVTHESWLPFEELPETIRAAGLTLGGPFGKTLQSRFVITGKTYQVLASGSPVLIGKNDVHEGFQDKENCLVVPQADAQALVDAISWAADHPKGLEKIGQAGRQLYEQRFSQRHINEIVSQLVGELQAGVKQKGSHDS